jgi:hypothetical protein
MMEDMEDKAAFPSDRYGEIGMTLRDYFAAQAMQGIIAVTVAPETIWSPKDLAESSYVMADAMLKARGE